MRSILAAAAGSVLFFLAAPLLVAGLVPRWLSGWRMSAPLLGAPALFAYAEFVALAFHLFVRFYEEPTLRERFGPQYDRYCGGVRRWWPRASPWVER